MKASEKLKTIEKLCESGIKYNEKQIMNPANRSVKLFHGRVQVYQDILRFIKEGSL